MLKILVPGRVRFRAARPQGPRFHRSQSFKQPICTPLDRILFVPFRVRGRVARRERADAFTGRGCPRACRAGGPRVQPSLLLLPRHCGSLIYPTQNTFQHARTINQSIDRFDPARAWTWSDPTTTLAAPPFWPQFTMAYAAAAAWTPDTARRRRRVFFLCALRLIL